MKFLFAAIGSAIATFMFAFMVGYILNLSGVSLFLVSFFSGVILPGKLIKWIYKEEQEVSQSESDQE